VGAGELGGEGLPQQGHGLQGHLAQHLQQQAGGLQGDHADRHLRAQHARYHRRQPLQQPPLRAHSQHLLYCPSNGPIILILHLGHLVGRLVQKEHFLPIVNPALGAEDMAAVTVVMGCMWPAVPLLSHVQIMQNERT
jgi:hypothetical protein